MAIKILSKGFGEHVTIESTSLPVKMQMQMADYYDGYGTLIDGAGDVITNNYYLPWIGDNYTTQFGGTYLASLFLTDITMDVLDSKEVAWDYSGNDFDREVVITYTYSNETSKNGGGTDAPRANEAAGWKVRYETSIETQSVQYWWDSDASEYNQWAHVYFWERNQLLKLMA